MTVTVTCKSEILERKKLFNFQALRGKSRAVATELWQKDKRANRQNQKRETEILYKQIRFYGMGEVVIE